MALIVGDDFQHILRVLNTNVDGREKVRQRFRFLLVREWAFGVRMRSSSLLKIGFRGGEALLGSCGSLLGRIASRDEWERWNATRARDGSWRGWNICTRECVSFEPFGCSRRARSGAKSDVILSFFSQKHTQKGESFYNPTRVSCSSSKTFCVLTTRQTRFLFSSRNRSCTLSRKSKASVVDLPTSSAKRRKSIWVKELGNSPLLNSNR